jgi:hypothetical protein
VTWQDPYQEDNMYGLAAIEQANGWAMAVTGAGIVLTGLAVLSFLISLLPRLTNIFEKKASDTVAAPVLELVPTPTLQADAPDTMDVESATYIALTEDLGDSFTLVDLHRKSKEAGLTHPHLSIRQFREAGLLVSAGEARFSWQPISK